MVFYQNNEWHLPTYKVVYTDDGEQLENTVGAEGKDWWEIVAKKHDDINVLEFIEIEPSDVEVARLEEVNELNIPDGFSTVLADYVENGTFPDEANHVLKDLENKNTRESSENYLLDVDYRVALMEMGL